MINVPAFGSEHVQYLPIFGFAIIAGYIFSYSNIRGAAVQHKMLALQALAGSIAHEMRNPLSQLKGILSCIRNSLPIPMQQQDIVLDPPHFKVMLQQLSMGFRAIEKSAQVITMTLDEVNNKPIDASTFRYLSARQITELTLYEYGYQSGSERQRVVFAGDDFVFKGDDTLFAFVLFNLLKNALFYTATHPNAKITVTVRAAADGQPNRVLVRDTGPGISKQALPKLFDSFYTAGKQGGAGLGLAYCKRVMTAFGGDITCDSVEEAFTEFCLTFPAVSPAALQAHHQQVIEQARPYLEGKQLLIVDAQASDRAIITNYLAPFAVIIDEAEDGEQAIATLKAHPYHLVVMGTQLPKLDGYQATQQIRAGLDCRHLTQGIAILGYSAEAYHEALLRATQVGMHGLQTKPCSQLSFIQSLEACVKKAAEPTNQRPGSLQNRTVLVVDDNNISRIVIRHSLMSYGINVIEATHGQQALEIIAKRPCDIVIMDLKMPGEIDGLTATQLLRYDSKYKHCSAVPVIGYSGDDTLVIQDIAKTIKMNAYLLKPVNPRDLLHALHHCLDPDTVDTFITNGPTTDEVMTEAMAQPPLTPGVVLPLQQIPLISEAQWHELQSTSTEEHLTRLLANLFASMKRTLCDYRIAFVETTQQETIAVLKKLNYKFIGEADDMAAQRLTQYLEDLHEQLEAGELPDPVKPWLTDLANLITASRVALYDRLMATFKKST